MKTHKERLAVEQAAIAGKRIQYRRLDDVAWMSVEDEREWHIKPFRWDIWDYREAPEDPFEVWWEALPMAASAVGDLRFVAKNIVPLPTARTIWDTAIATVTGMVDPTPDHADMLRDICEKERKSGE